MDDNKNDLFHRQSSEGLGWADQWDYKNTESNDSTKTNGSGGSKTEKMKQVGTKANAVASVGWEKTKVGASFAATKTKAGVGWIKQQVDKRRAPK
jgi:hypothetical protein